MNPLDSLRDHGQRIWFDNLQRSLIWNGTLHRMVTEGGVSGVLSNPSIFEAAIAESADYSPAIAALIADGLGAAEIYEQLAVEDLQWACDVLRPVYDDTDGRDGYCSLAVSPHLARDAMETIDEATRLWDTVGRDNLMVQIPGTQAGLSAVRELIAQGINVNVSLVFSVDRYRAAHDAYLEGVEDLVRAGGDPSSVASVVSVYVSRLDTIVDAHIDQRLTTADDAVKAKLEALRGRAATAVAKLTYQAYRDTVASERWMNLASQGARTQRLLWASTSAKDPAFHDVRYVEELLGAETVVAMTAATYDAFKDHGRTDDALVKGLADAEATIARLAEADLSIATVATTLEDEGVNEFISAYDGLMASIQGARTAIMDDAQPSMDLQLGAYEDAVDARIHRLDDQAFVRRLWGRDGTLFGEDDSVVENADASMGWLDTVEAMGEYVEHLVELQDELETAEVESVVLMGMGGSSLAPDVLARTFGQLDGSPELLILDSTVPAQIRAIEGEISPEESVFIVASKSGSTIEPRSLEAHFFEQIQSADRFVAITDPESVLEAEASMRDFFAIYSGDPEVGGRYGALSPFGMVPAAAMGLDVDELLDRAQLMVASCSAAVPAAHNPGVALGAALGELARSGRDKLTFVASGQMQSFGAWLEQLIAESTGKNGVGILPVDGEALGPPEVYGDDRVFAYIALEDDDDDVQSKVLDKLDALASAGHPVLTFVLSDPRDLMQEMFRWQVATAAAAHVLGVNPFDQPDVQISKDFANELLHGYVTEGHRPVVPDRTTIADDLGLTAWAKPGSEIAAGALADVLSAFLGRATRGDYVALQAFIEMSDEHDAALQHIRLAIRDQYRVATTVGFGPRYLHSTGQLHKGGPNTGHFIQLTADDPEDFEVPGRNYSFGVLKDAQQAGDFMALSARDRRVIQVHLGADPQAGLERLAEILIPSR